MFMSNMYRICMSRIKGLNKLVLQGGRGTMQGTIERGVIEKEGGGIVGRGTSIFYLFISD